MAQRENDSRGGIFDLIGRGIDWALRGISEAREDIRSKLIDEAFFDRAVSEGTHTEHEREAGTKEEPGRYWYGFDPDRSDGRYIAIDLKTGKGAIYQNPSFEEQWAVRPKLDDRERPEREIDR